MDELESELRTLDREIAQFVLEAFQREAPDALRTQLAAAMAEGLRPLQRTLETISGALAEARGDAARSAQDGFRQSSSLQADIAGRAQQAQEQAERRTAELQQALALTRSELALARREIQAAAGLRASAPPPASAGEGPDRRNAPSRAGSAWWSRYWTWVTGGAAALVIILVAALLMIRPSGLFTAQPAPGASEGAAPATAAAAAGAPSVDQAGFARVLAQVSGAWTGERRNAALATLCGAGAATCPDLQKRWLAGGRSRKEVEAALAVTVAALAEMDGCTASPASQPPRADADPLATWTCLLTEAGRAPHA